MKGTTSNNIIIPQTEGYLLVLTIQEGQHIETLCYFSPDFTSTLLSDNNIMKSNLF